MLFLSEDASWGIVRASSQVEKMFLAGETASMSDSLKKDPGIAVLGASGGDLCFKHKEPCL